MYSTDHSGAPHTAVQCRDVEKMLNVGKCEKKWELSFLYRERTLEFRTVSFNQEQSKLTLFKGTL